MKKMKLIMAIFFAGFMLFAAIPSTHAYTVDATALDLTPVDYSSDFGGYWEASWGWYGNQSSNAIIMTIAGVVLPAGVTEVYKDEITAEVGLLVSSYETDHVNGNDWTITYVGEDYISSNPYALVKDGNAEPNWYLISLEGWNGTDDLVFVNFFEGAGNEGGGSISHISLFGGFTQVPEPSILLLISLALFGIGTLKRFKM